MDPDSTINAYKKWGQQMMADATYAIQLSKQFAGEESANKMTDEELARQINDEELARQLENEDHHLMRMPRNNFGADDSEDDREYDSETNSGTDTEDSDRDDWVRGYDQAHGYDQDYGPDDIQQIADDLLAAEPEKEIHKQSDDIVSLTLSRCNIGSKSDAADCCICMCSIGPDVDCTIIPCGHKFHFDCICESISYKSECPLCKAEI